MKFDAATLPSRNATFTHFDDPPHLYDFTADFFAVIEGVDPSYRVPIHAIDFEFVTNQIVCVPDDDAIGFRIEIDNVTRTRRTTRQSFTLADSEKLYAAVFAHEISVHVINFAAVKLAFAQMRAQECFVIVSWYKADFLAIDFVRDSEPQRMRYFSDLGLSHSTKRRKGAQELRLAQAEQKVRLILSWIDSLAKHGESRCGAVAAFPFTRRGRRV